MTAATILNITPARLGAGGTRYFFDAEFPNGLKIYRMRLAETRNGLRVFGPKDNFGYAVTLPISLADELVVLAQQEAVAKYGRS